MEGLGITVKLNIYSFNCAVRCSFLGGGNDVISLNLGSALSIFPTLVCVCVCVLYWTLLPSNKRGQCVLLQLPKSF